MFGNTELTWLRTRVTQLEAEKLELQRRLDVAVDSLLVTAGKRPVMAAPKPPTTPRLESAFAGLGVLELPAQPKQ